MRLSLFAFILIAAVFLLFVLALTRSAADALGEQAEARIDEQNHALVDMISTYNAGLVAEVGRFMGLLDTSFNSSYAIDTVHQVKVGTYTLPTLTNGGAALDLDFRIPDQFTAQTGAVATVFQRNGDEFIRVTTSLKKQNGDRALASQLDHQHPAYRRLLDGQTFSGLATLFGKQYITQYKPIRDANGQVIGALFVGVDVSAEIDGIKQKIRDKKIAQDGYFFVLDADPNGKPGQYLVHPTDQGQSALTLRDHDGVAVFQRVLDMQSGRLLARFAGDSQTHLVSFAYQPDWHWIIGGNVVQDELTAAVRTAQIEYSVLGLVLVLLLALGNFVLVHRIVSRPLRHAVDVAKQLAAGDLTQREQVDRNDEIGELLTAIYGIGSGLAAIVTQVRAAVGMMDDDTTSIAADTADIAQRIASQASSLEETAASMEQITSTVQQNATNAMAARDIAQTSAQHATEGGDAVQRVVQTMATLNQSSQKIFDIVSVIESIAFQTNILALNASVEAARAGEQGRGFAVVASEVRALAQRSGDAAKEISVLVHASVDQIKQGYTLADAAADTIHAVVDEAQRMSSVISEITLASKEQSIGIEQVNLAVSQIGAVMQENALLVNQTEEAAFRLSEESTELSRTVAVFKV